MPIRARRSAKHALFAIVLASLVTAGIVFAPGRCDTSSPPAQAANGTTVGEIQLSEKDTICLPPGMDERIGVQTCRIENSSSPAMLEMSGTLMLDADRLSHVHARFAGEVVELGPGDGPSPAVCFGQRVRKGQLLAVIWSRDLGEKKSDLIDALSQLRVDEESLARVSKGAAEAPFPSGSSATPSGRWRPTALPPRGRSHAAKLRIPQEEIDRCGPRPIGSCPEDAGSRGVGCAVGETRSPLSAGWHDYRTQLALGDLVDTNLDLFKVAHLPAAGGRPCVRGGSALARRPKGRPPRVVGHCRFRPSSGEPAMADSTRSAASSTPTSTRHW